MTGEALAMLSAYITLAKFGRKVFTIVICFSFLISTCVLAASIYFKFPELGFFALANCIAQVWNYKIFSILKLLHETIIWYEPSRIENYNKKDFGSVLKAWIPILINLIILLGILVLFLLHVI